MGYFDVSRVVREPMSRKLLIVVNEPNFFLSHRLPVALAALKSGHDVHIATGPGEEAIAKIKQHGLKHHDLPLSRSGRNLMAEMLCVFSIIKLFFNEKPDVVHLVTLKPVIYGGIAARICNVKLVVGAVSGLGYSFASASFGARVSKFIITRLLGLAISSKTKIIFQNRDDLNLFKKLGFVNEDQSVLIKGSGVNLDEYKYVDESNVEPVVITFAARLLKDKGIYEFLSAAKDLKKVYGSRVVFQVAGSVDIDNPSSISVDVVEKHSREGVINFLAYRPDMADVFANTNIVVLPSYREGLPKVLIEAAAVGRAIVTTDVPGCRDVIIPERTGLAVKVRDAESLKKAIAKLVDEPLVRRQMGIEGRKLAEKEFNITSVIEKHLDLYSQPLN